MSEMRKDDKKSPWSTFLLMVLFVALMLVVGAGLVDRLLPWGRWLIIAGLMIAFLAALGVQVNGRLDGVLIDSRFKISLSRLQIALWTILVLSAYLTIALHRSLPDRLPETLTVKQVEQCVEYLKEQDSEKANEIKALKEEAEQIKTLKEKDPEKAAEKAEEILMEKAAEKTEEIKALKEEDPKKAAEKAEEILMEKATEECTPGEPLNITFPTGLMVALGISAASFAGSTLVKSTKKGKKPDLKLLEKKVKEAKEELKEKKSERDKVSVPKKKLERDVAKRRVDEAKAKMGEAETEKRQAEERLSRAGTDDEKRKAQDELTEAESELEKAKEELKKAQDELAGAQVFVVTAQAKAGPTAENLNEARGKLREAKKELEEAKTQAEGLEHQNASSADAKWIDIFRGEEIGNHKLIDMAKVQMFLFTIVAVFSYSVIVYGLLKDTTVLMNPLGVDFPAFSSSLNALLAISHGGYLTVKTVDHTPVES